MTNDFLYPRNSKIDEKEPRYNETSFSPTNFVSALALRYVEVLTVLTEDTVFVSSWRRDRQFYVFGATHGKGSTFTA